MWLLSTSASGPPKLRVSSVDMIGLLKELFGVSAEKHKPKKIDPVAPVKRDMVEAVRGRGYRAVTREQLKREMRAACEGSIVRKSS